MKTFFSYCTRVLLAGLFCLTAFPVMSEEKTMYLPLAGYDYLSLESRAIHSPSLGTMIIGENFTFAGIYTRHSFSGKAPQDYPDAFHSIEIILDTKIGRHQVLSIFKSESDQPVSGGWATFQSAAIYGYRLVENETMKVILGGGVALSDFGIDLKNGKPWPVLPVPYINIEYHTPIIEAGFNFITGPNLSMTLLPESKFRFSGDIRINQFRDIRDLIFEAALHYRFFTAEDPSGDFAGLAVGVKNDSFGFTPGGSDEPYEIQYGAVFTELDLSILKITGGYAFSGRERFGDTMSEESGKGYFLTFQGMYQF